MRSIDVRVEPTVRLVRAVEGVENTKPCILMVNFELCVTTLPLRIQLVAFCTRLKGAYTTRTAEGQAAPLIT
jgi:hypothetical protein